ncbi:hypothetical protein GOP47_0024100 [Adiantum capillus-veneris]|uniref:Uncharacterized protein n=1 Tax=Adiantum capillus-veneris TaxID=13818 RepID=A0A9D4U597_ADICA|nr:hypothetical protein GOP47_0024100 [Adiantum capillus-veneris]
MRHRQSVAEGGAHQRRGGLVRAEGPTWREQARSKRLEGWLRAGKAKESQLQGLYHRAVKSTWAAYTEGMPSMWLDGVRRALLSGLAGGGRNPGSTERRPGHEEVTRDTSLEDQGPLAAREREKEEEAEKCNSRGGEGL